MVFALTLCSVTAQVDRFAMTLLVKIGRAHV